MMTDLSLDADSVPLLAGELQSVAGNCCSSMNSIINRLPDSIPTAHVISSEDFTGQDAAHFDSEGYRKFGKRYAVEMLSLIGYEADHAEAECGTIDGDIHILADENASNSAYIMCTVHPLNKQEVGHRLALIANKLVYKQDCEASGPFYKSFKIEGNRIRISFKYTASGLSTRNGEELTGFAIAGNDRQIYWAKAVIERNEVVVYSDKVTEPKVVRYAWADNPDCNLINSEGLPAIPFRTDDWKGITQK